MYKITKETIVRANERTMKRGRGYFDSVSIGGGVIKVSTRYRGVIYTKRLEIKELQKDYQRSYNAVRNANSCSCFSCAPLSSCLDFQTINIHLP